MAPMKKNRFVRLLLTGVLTATLVLSVGGGILAAEDSSTEIGLTPLAAQEDVEEAPSGSEPPASGEPGVVATLVTMESAEVGVGETATLDLELMNVTDLGALTLSLTFDTDTCEVVNIVDGDLATVHSNVAGANSAGEIGLSYFGTEGVSGSFVLLSVQFEALGAPGASSMLTPVVTTLVDAGSSAIPHSVQKGTFLVEMVYDFGDAPEPSYPTTLAEDGAKHCIVPGFHLGSGLDWESDGQPHSHAAGDDAAGDDDEDGIEFTSVISPGKGSVISVSASDGGKLDAWIDFNDDGDWNDDGEQILCSEALSAGTNTVDFVSPVDAIITESTIARFRFSSNGGLGPTGLAEDGEVEDYEIAIQPTPPAPPGELACMVFSQTGIQLDWPPSEDADSTVIVRSTSGYPTAWNEGEEVYSGDSTTYVDNGLTPETTYYYSAWAYNSSTGLYSEAAAETTATTLPSVASWTLMVYVADDDPSFSPYPDMNTVDMAEVGSSHDVNIVVQHDESGRDGTWRYYVAGGDVYLLEEMDESNTGNPDTLTDFVAWASEAYPAEQYALIMWDHAMGREGDPPLDGVIHDCNPGEEEPEAAGVQHNEPGCVVEGDTLTIAELADALAEMDTSIDLLWLDSHLIQRYEVIYQLAASDGAPGIVVGSEALVPEDAWPYSDVITNIIEVPALTAEQFAQETVSSFVAAYSSGQAATLSAIETPSAEAMADTAHNFAAALIASSYQAEISDARTEAQSYGNAPFCDVIDFCDEIIANVPDCATESQQMKDIVTAFVIAEGHSSGVGVDGSNGCSVYLPPTAEAYVEQFDPMALPGNTWWDDFLRGGLDYGDAPDPGYPVTAANNGACHTLGGPYLGTAVDAELDAHCSEGAAGDDENGEDEDGVSFVHPLSVGRTINIDVTASATGFLDAWIDYNADGDWADPDEQIFSSTEVMQGTNRLSLSVPSGLSPVDNTYARFRISSEGSLSYSGPADDGEVEDYVVDIVRLVEGDPTRDYQTNIVDAMFIAQFTVGLREFDSAQLECADTNDDGVVNIVDAMHLAQYTVDPTGSAGVLFSDIWNAATDPLTDPPD